ncbi:MAG: extradiol dioxygenase [Proteobacteria bacterium]|nr:extradiol dioxygenase [Pseudomonadota bacterium]
MITGAHVMFFSKNAEADRAFLRDVLGLPHVDAGGGWLIFALPPSEAGVHPSDKNDVHEVYFMTDNLDAEIARLKEKGVACGAPAQQSWGVSTNITLPSGGTLGLYQPRHATAR